MAYTRVDSSHLHIIWKLYHFRLFRGQLIIEVCELNTHYGFQPKTALHNSYVHPPAYQQVSTEEKDANGSQVLLMQL